MRRFVQMLLAVLFCMTVVCITDVSAATNTSDNAASTKKIIIINTKSSQDSVQNQSSDQSKDSVQSTKPVITNTTKKSYSEEEVYLTAQLIHHEAHNQPYQGKVAIAEVVLNRVRSGVFPSSIEDVIYQTGQFSNSRRIKNIIPTDLEVRIADNVLNGSLRIFNDTGILYFRNPSVTSGLSADVDKDWGNLDYVTCIGDHAFYSHNLMKLAANASQDNKSDKKAVSSDKKDITVEKTSEGSGKQDISADKKQEQAVDETSTEEETVLAPEYVTNEMLLAAANFASVNMAVTKVEEEEIDENDPVALAQRQAKLDAEREEQQRAAMQAEYDKANQAASDEAQRNVSQATMRVEAALAAGQN